MDAMQMLHDTKFAKQNEDTDQYSIVWDSGIQKMCFEYLDEYSFLNKENK
jgi:hypothetical protein